jgi:predicted PurR-regulated permease PerM
MERTGGRRIELLLPARTLLAVLAVIGIAVAFRAIGDTFLIVFIGIFLALVFEYPVRFVMEKTRMSRGLAATVTVLGTAVAVVLLMLVLLVPLVGSVRDYLQDLPQTVQSLRESDEFPSWLGDSGAAENVQDGAQEVSVSVPDAISAVLGIAGSFFGVFLAGFTILFICLFLLSDITNLKRSLASVLMPGEDDRWLDVWERVTTSISRWAIGVVVIATIAGTTQGVTAWLLGSSYAIGLGVIAGLLDMIPNIGATIAGFVLVPTLWAEEGVTAAIIMLIVVLVYQQVENNILTPKIQGKAVELSGFFIIVAVTLFGALLGVLGALTAVPLAATIQIFIQELTKARREKVAAAKAAPGPASPSNETLPGCVASQIAVPRNSAYPIPSSVAREPKVWSRVLSAAKNSEIAKTTTPRRYSSARWM